MGRSVMYALILVHVVQEQIILFFIVVYISDFNSSVDQNMCYADQFSSGNVSRTLS